MTMQFLLQFHILVKMKNGVLRLIGTFTFIFRVLLLFIGNPTMDTFMQAKKLLQNKPVAFATLVATRRPRSTKEGALVHASGTQENGYWRPLVRPNVWTHVHRRILEAKA